jgi:hypothetical protein
MQQTPPPFEMPSGPRPRSNPNRTLWIVAAVILFICCAGVIVVGYFALGLAKQMLPMMGCMGQASEINQALRAYVKDHNGKLPAAAKWQQELEKYYQQLPRDKMTDFSSHPSNHQGCFDADGNQISTFAYNSDVAGKMLAKIKDPDETPLVFEVPQTTKDLAMPFQNQDPDKSPSLIMGQRRGWLQVMASGSVYMLMKEEDGRIKRIPANSANTKIYFDEDRAKEVKEPANEPVKQ